MKTAIYREHFIPVIWTNWVPFMVEEKATSNDNMPPKGRRSILRLFRRQKRRPG